MGALNPVCKFLTIDKVCPTNDWKIDDQLTIKNIFLMEFSITGGSKARKD